MNVNDLSHESFSSSVLFYPEKFTPGRFLHISARVKKNNLSGLHTVCGADCSLLILAEEDRKESGKKLRKRLRKSDPPTHVIAQLLKMKYNDSKFVKA